jgi:hypothetical protein
MASSGISSFNGDTLHTGIVERRIQPPKCRNCLLDHRLHLCFIGDIAADSNRLMAGSDQALGGYPYCRFIDINQRDRSTLCCKCLRRSQAIPEPAPVTSATLFSKDKFIDRFLLHLMCLPACSRALAPVRQVRPFECHRAFPERPCCPHFRCPHRRSALAERANLLTEYAM